ncbi:MAG: hypothetical protein NUV68_03940 [Caldiserica bacterium]|jgi:hypothetical protein|nr:hypothetical protein [Caldisericota bacterium]MDH7562306.1 hypothetical protein [Caldisericota bacterium]
MRIFLWDTDGAYREQSELFKVCEGIIQYPFPRLILEEDLFPKVEELLPPLPSLSFLGSGDFHFLSFFLQKKIGFPFRLLLFDFHLDFKESQEGFLSCGNWLNRVLGLKNCSEVWILGAGEQRGIDPRVRFEDPMSLDWRKLFSLPLYISLDKDVLSPAELELAWDQGTWTKEELINLLTSTLSEGVNLVGADVCGEPILNPSDFSFNSQNQMDKSEKLNLRIAHLFEGLKPFVGPG